MPDRSDKMKIDTLQTVELGDGVEILLRIAGPFVRSMALLIDYLIIIGLLIVLGIFASFLEGLINEGVATGVLLIGFFLMSWGYFAFFECGKKGATPGKRSMGIRVVDRSGNSANKGQVLVRNLLRIVDMLPGVPTGANGILVGGYGVGLTACFLSKKFQRLGDIVANTVVVYNKPVQQISMSLPPALKSVAPPVVLTREEQAAIASFQERAGMWSEARRMEIANHASGMTGTTNHQGLNDLLGMARWLTGGKE